ncbi:MAG: hypothetical protein ACON4Z_00305 [Planctomycetota bacterium]
MPRLLELALVVVTAAVAAAQQPVRPSEVAPRPGRAATAADAAWSEGVGRAPSFRAALAGALGEAGTGAGGAALRSEPAVRSRLAVVAASREADPAATASWVSRQVSGFIRRFEILNRSDLDGAVQVRVRALVAGLDAARTSLVIDLQDGGLSSWRMERFEQGGPGRAFDERSGAFRGPGIADYLRRSGVVEVASGPAERGADALSPSHRVALEWKPVTVRSAVERPNKARPTKGPRPEHMTAGVVEVSLRIDDLQRGVALLDEAVTVSAPQPEGWPVARLDAFVTNLVDEAKARISQKIFFTLRPPVVLRKWAGDGGDWFVEARVAERVAASYSAFALGVDGSLASPDWQPLARAELIGGSAASCTFCLKALADPAQIRVGVSQVRPVR